MFTRTMNRLYGIATGCVSDVFVDVGVGLHALHLPLLRILYKQLFLLPRAVNLLPRHDLYPPLSSTMPQMIVNNTLFT